MPLLDTAFTALLEDLADRGLLDDTLVVWMAEFGRTPKINGAGGRDHWGPVFSVALAGGGVKGGAVYGASDKLAAYPKDGRVHAAGPARDDLPLPGHPEGRRDPRRLRPPARGLPRRTRPADPGVMP